MRITVPSSAPVQSLGRKAPAARDTSMEQALQSVQADLENVRNIKGKRQVQQSRLFAQKGSDEIKAQWGGRESFSVEELPSEVVTEGMLLEGRVNSAEVYPEIYRLSMDKVLKDAALIIDDAQFRSDWQAEANIKISAANSAIQQKANKDIETQIYSDQKRQYSTADSNGDTASMLAIVDNMRELGVASNEDLKFFELKAQKSGETNAYTEAKIAADVPLMKDIIEFLKEEKGYRKNGGNLNDRERLVEIHKLQTEIGKIERSNSSTVKAEKKMVAREVRINIKNLLSGKAADTSGMLDLVDKAQSVNLSPAKIQDLRSAFNFASANDGQILMSRFERPEAVEQAVARSGLKGFEKTELKNRLEESHRKQSLKEKDDPMQSASDAGFASLSPIDAETPREFAMQVRTRIQQMDGIQENYQIFEDKPFTKTEAALLSDRVNNLPAGKKAEYLQSLTLALGEDSALVYEQLGIDGGVGALSIAGITSLHGTEDQAFAILKGGEYLEKNKEEITTVKSTLNPRIRRDLGDMFFNAEGTQAATKEALTNAYTYYVKKKGGNFDSFDDDAYDKAMQAATGGTVTYGDNLLQAPVFGMKQDDFSDWVENTDPAWIDELGSISGMSSANFTSILKDGDFKMGMAKYGEYYIMRNNGDHLENETFGGAFVLKYNPDKVLPKAPRGRGRLRERARVNKLRDSRGGR